MFSIPSASSKFTIIQHISVFVGCFDKNDQRFFKSFSILSSYIALYRFSFSFIAPIPKNNPYDNWKKNK